MRKTDRNRISESEGLFSQFTRAARRGPHLENAADWIISQLFPTKIDQLALTMVNILYLKTKQGSCSGMMDPMYITSVFDRDCFYEAAEACEYDLSDEQYAKKLPKRMLRNRRFLL